MSSKNYQYQQPVYEEDIRPISKIDFRIYGNHDVKKHSVFGKDSIGIDIADLYDNLEPKRGGLIDKRLGVVDNHLDCDTCGLNNTECVGHFGHTDLVEPVFHVGFLDTVRRILSCICLKCSKLLIYKNEDEIEHMLKTKSRVARFNEIRNLTKNVTYCQKHNYGCGTPVSKIKKEIKKNTCEINLISEIILTGLQLPQQTQQPGSEITTIFDGKKKLRQILTPEDCFNILKNISDLDCKIMGFDTIRPDDMIIKVLGIPPVNMRPSVKADFMGASMMEDDLTHKLAEIIRANIRTRKYKETTSENSAKYLQDHATFLQYHVATYYDNDVASLPKSEQKGKITKSLTARMPGKQGRLRGNLMGKRVDFSARTVVTADPTIDINQLKVPIIIAMELTIPEEVTANNIERLQQLVKNGTSKYPGANYVFPKNKSNKAIFLKYRKDKVELRIGDIVERHLVDDDYVLLNRQPTLHKLSMMAHKIKVIRNFNLKTFGLNVAVTTPYGADFDGDEMNMHVPQSIQTQIELEYIADVKRQIISPRMCTPIIAGIQDSLIGCYVMTEKDTVISFKDALNILSYSTIKLNKLNKLMQSGKLTKSSNLSNLEISGKDLFSMIIPETINITDRVEIKNGVIIKGQLNNKHIGGGAENSIPHLIWSEYGFDKTKEFIDNSQRLTNNFNLYYGFTVGISDIDIPKNIEDEITNMYNTVRLKISYLITELENNPMMYDISTFENIIHAELGVITPKVSELVFNNLKYNNGYKIMMSSGSKGKPHPNMGQIAGCVGQQSLEGKIIKKKLNQRTLAYFHQNDDTPLARGFVKQSFIQGLTPTAMIMHNIASREGLIDTAVKTSRSGYMQRKLIKSMEDILVKYDMTVRNATENIIQFIYSDNGVNPINLSTFKSDLISLDNSQVKTKYLFTPDELKNLTNYTQKANIDHLKFILNMRDNLRSYILKRRLNKEDYITIKDYFMLSINIPRILNNIKATNKDKSSVSDIKDPTYIINKIESIISYNNTKILALSSADIANKNSLKHKDELAAKALLKYALYEVFSPKICILDLKITKQTFDDIINDIIKTFNANLFEPGEMVGILSAQTTGEPTTQLVMKTFQHAGISSKGTQGIPRLSEILSVTKNMKTPLMSLYFNKEIGSNKLEISRIASYMKFTALSDIRKRVDIYYDPISSNKTSRFMTEDNVTKLFFKSTETSKSVHKNSCSQSTTDMPWLIRIVLDKEKMIDRHITLIDIKTKFCNKWERRYKQDNKLKREDKELFEKVINCTILSNSDNDKLAIIHIRLTMINYNYNTLISFLDMFVDNIKLKGVHSIAGISSLDEQKTYDFNGPDQSIGQSSEYVLTTEGINLISIRYINGIDLSRVRTNDILETYYKYGIEAARVILYDECKGVFERGGTAIKFTNLSILIDIMTNSGGITTIDRHGLNKLDTDPFARASFERPVDQLINAAIFGQTDKMQSVSSRIMAGLVIKGGTGLCEIMLDTDFLERSEYTEYLPDVDSSQALYNKTFNELGLDNVIQDTLSKDKGETFNMFIPI